jgi:uridine kinase
MAAPKPRVLGLEEAIHAIAVETLALERRAVVGITGAVAAGKSTFAQRLAQRLAQRMGGEMGGHAQTVDIAMDATIDATSDAACTPVLPSRRVVVLSTDHYLPDYDRTPEHLRDLPESSDLVRLAHDLSELRAGRAARVPQWSFETHARTGEVDVGPADVVIVEGLHALHDLPRVHVDWAIFVEAPREVRWSRAVERERAGDRPWPIEYLEHFFTNVAEPTFALHAERYRATADFIVAYRAENAERA